MPRFSCWTGLEISRKKKKKNCSANNVNKAQDEAVVCNSWYCLWGTVAVFLRKCILQRCKALCFMFIYRFLLFFFPPICFLSSSLCPLFCSSHLLPSHGNPKVFRQNCKTKSEHNETSQILHGKTVFKAWLFQF